MEENNILAVSNFTLYDISQSDYQDTHKNCIENVKILSVSLPIKLFVKAGGSNVHHSDFFQSPIKFTK